MVRARASPPGRCPATRTSVGLERNVLLPTAVGALRPSALVPETMAAGGDVAAARARLRSRDARAARLAPEPVRRQPTPVRDRGALRRCWSSKLERADMSALGIARQVRRSRLAGAVLLPSWRSRCGPRSTSGCRRCSGLRDPHGVWTDLEHRLGRRVFEIPTLPPSVPGHAPVRDPALGAARCRRPTVLGAEVVGADRDGERITTVYAACSPGATSATRRRLDRARGGRLRVGCDRARLALGHARARARSRRSMACPRPASRGSWPRTSTSSRWRASASRSTPTCVASGTDNVLVAGAALPGAMPVARGIGRGDRARERLSCRAVRARQVGRAGGGDVSDGSPARAAARIARSLRQVHDLRDAVPGLERDAAVPGAEVRGPAGGALPGRRRAVGRLVGRLLLGVRDLLDGLSAGGQDRRDQRPGPQQAQAAEGRPAPRPDHHAADLARAGWVRRSRRWPTSR